jgi:hypothetical protein
MLQNNPERFFPVFRLLPVTESTAAAALALLTALSAVRCS